MEPFASRRMATWVLALACVSAAHAGAVYRCTANGVVAYQDRPCPGQSPAQASQVDAGVGTTDIAHLSPVALMERLRQLAAQERDLDSQRDKALAGLKARLAGEHDDRLVSREVERYKQEWQQRLAASRQVREAVLDRLRQLCPGGASGSGSQVTCHPGQAAGDARMRPD